MRLPFSEEKIWKRMEIAHQIAMEAEGIRSKRSKFKIGAVLYVGNRLVSIGYNSRKSSPFQARFGRNRDAIFFHAETHAIYNALREHDEDELVRHRTSLYIVRVKRNPENHSQVIWGLSSPCSGCMRAIQLYRIDHVFFSLDEDLYGGKKFGAISGTSG